MQQNDTPSQAIYVCPTTEIPNGEMRCFQVLDRRILIANTEIGWFASDEMCTHEDASLCDGNLTDSLVKCPLHGSRFDLRTGKVLDDPADEDLQVYRVVIDRDQIYIEMQTEPQN